MSVWQYLGYLLAVLSGGCLIWQIREVFFRKALETRPQWFSAPDLVIAFAIALLLAWAGWESFSLPAEPLKLSAIQSAYFVQGFFTALIFSYLHFRKIPLRSFLQAQHLPPWKTLAIAMALLAAFLPFVLGVANLFDHSDADDQEVVRFFVSHPKLADRLWVIVLAAVVAPFSEELLFRGFLYGIFQQHFGKISSAFFTSVLFALIHGNAYAFLPLVLLAMALNTALEKTGSLIVPMIMHATFNTLTLLVLWLWPNL